MSSADGDSPLLAHLRARIEREGPLQIDAYMRICLADPQHGYWRGETIGADGDFVTAPEISQVFGELIGLWAGVVWQEMGAPTPLHLVELGPGRGTLLRDALRAARSLPQFLAAASVHLVERSAPLREAQRRTLASWLRRPKTELAGQSCPSCDRVARMPARGKGPPAAEGGGAPNWRGGEQHGHDVAIEWHEAIGTVPEGPAIVIGNEFLDALPIRQLVCVDGAWHERVVDVDGRGGLRFAVGPVTDIGGQIDGTPGAVFELRAGEEELF